METTTASTTSLLATYGIDIFLVIVFVYIFFFCKPDSKDEENILPEEEPNELEKILRTDPPEKTDSTNNKSE